MSKLQIVTNDLVKIINREIWIELKKHIWMFNFKQKIERKTIYKIIHEKNEIVFAAKHEKGTDEIFILNDKFKTKCIEKHRKYINWTGDYKTLFQEHFRFLLMNYNFKFKYTEFKNAVDKNDKFFYYGPVYCMSFNNDYGCINFILLVQRGEWDVYITDKETSKQSEIRKGRHLSDGFKNLKSFSENDKNSIKSNRDYISIMGQYIYKEINIYNEVFGIQIKEKINLGIHT